MLFDQFILFFRNHLYFSETQILTSLFFRPPNYPPKYLGAQMVAAELGRRERQKQAKFAKKF